MADWCRPLTCAATATLVTAAWPAATLVPARRTTRVDPTIAVRAK